MGDNSKGRRPQILKILKNFEKFVKHFAQKIFSILYEKTQNFEKLHRGQISEIWQNCYFEKTHP